MDTGTGPVECPDAVCLRGCCIPPPPADLSLAYWHWLSHGPWSGALVAWGAYCVGCVPPFTRAIAFSRCAGAPTFSTASSVPWSRSLSLIVPAPLADASVDAELVPAGAHERASANLLFGSCVGSLPNVCAYVPRHVARLPRRHCRGAREAVASWLLGAPASWQLWQRWSTSHAQPRGACNARCECSVA